MFGDDDTCQLSLDGLLDVVGVSRRTCPDACSALLAAGVIVEGGDGTRAASQPLPPPAGAWSGDEDRRREKVFGPGRAVPLDGNAKARIQAYARAWSGRNRQPGQHKGPITRAFLDVLQALLWGFHNSRTGVLLPSYEAIADKAECARTTVAEALKVLELAGVLSWQHRHHPDPRGAARDLFGHHGWRWRVIRTSNAYVFRDPKAAVSGGLLPSPKIRREP